jgi:hypothetical protein
MSWSASIRSRWAISACSVRISPARYPHPAPRSATRPLSGGTSATRISDPRSGASAENPPGAVTYPSSVSIGRAIQSATASGTVAGRRNQISLPWALENTPSTSTWGFRAFRTASIPSSFAPSIRIRPPGTTAPMASATADRCVPWISRSASARRRIRLRRSSSGRTAKPRAASRSWSGRNPCTARPRPHRARRDRHRPAPSARGNGPPRGGARLCRARGSICRGSWVRDGAGDRVQSSFSIVHCSGCWLRRAKSITCATLVSAIS